MSFKNRMLDYVVSQVLANFLKALDTQELKAILDQWIDSVENAVENSESKFDDNLLPVLSFVRDFFAIPDLPDRG